MAAEDYVAADRKEWQGTADVTAADRVAQTVQATPDADAKAAAVAAGVSNAAYIGYAAALVTHQNRPDIESLADRRTREAATTFAAADFMRANAYKPDGTADNAPRPGTVYGDAPASS